MPKIELSENSWDFGYVPKDEIVTHTFTIRNAGDDSLFINKIRLSCCCTHLPLLKSRLAPGEKTEMEIAFNSHKVRGEVEKTVHINSNDTTAQISGIFINARVGAQNMLVELVPDRALFKNGEKGKSVWVKNISDSFVQVSVVSPPESPVDYKIDDLNIAPFDSTEISFSKREGGSQKPFKTSLILDFLGAKKVRCTIPIRTIETRK